MYYVYTRQDCIFIKYIYNSFLKFTLLDNAKARDKSNHKKIYNKKRPNKRLVNLKNIQIALVKRKKKHRQGTGQEDKKSK